MPKTVIITGCSSGIGKATALYFAIKGWNVAATMRSLETQEDFSNYSNIKSYVLDVNDKGSVEGAVAKIIEDFRTIDVLVNNAGYAVDGVFEAIDDLKIEKQFNTNVFGLMRVTRAIIPHMRKNKRGVIVQIASMGGRLTFPLYSVYHATKWAVEGFSESLQFELRQFNIKIKIIEPGVIKTAFYGKSREKVSSKSLAEYENFIEKCELVSQGSRQSGVDAAVVAKKIFQAATSSGWGLRFSVGSPAPRLLLLREILPESLFLFLMRRGYKI